LRSRSSTNPAETPQRQAFGSPVASSMPGSAMNSVSSPSLPAIFCHSVAKWPVSTISTASPRLIVLASAASQAPVPDDG
jgi:hypothetical protein